MMMLEQKTRPSGATPGRVMETGRVGKSGRFQGYSTISGIPRQFWVNRLGVCY